MSEVDDAIAAARASWSRISDAPAAPPAPRRRGEGQMTLAARAALIGAVNAALLAAAMALGVRGLGALVVMLLMVGVTLAIAMTRAVRAPTRPEKLRDLDLRALPAQTDRWLRAQRPQLPPPAQHLLDRIGDRLGTLSPQLGRVDPDGEQAGEIRRLVGEQLPAFVADYGRVPPPLRRTSRNGRTPDAALTDGLAVIEREIGAMTERLAADDLDSLQTRGRFLEMKYSGDQR